MYAWHFALRLKLKEEDESQERDPNKQGRRDIVKVLPGQSL